MCVSAFIDITVFDSYRRFVSSLHVVDGPGVAR